MAISLKKWRSISSSTYKETIYLGRNQSNRQKQEIKEDKNGKWQWNKLWRRINREKKRIFSAPSVTLYSSSYDPDDYFQNFDNGTSWQEPDNLPRSFSARFAYPSRSVLIKNSSVRNVRGV